MGLGERGQLRCPQHVDTGFRLAVAEVSSVKKKKRIKEKKSTSEVLTLQQHLRIHLQPEKKALSFIFKAVFADVFHCTDLKAQLL